MAYETVNVAVNAVLFSLKESELCVYVDKREKAPFKGKLELPGGLLLANETALDTLNRKLEGILKTKVELSQFQTFTEVKRDPRVRTISIGYFAVVDADLFSNGTKLVPVKDNLAFDHDEIILKAKDYIKNNISPKIFSNAVPDKFPINRLQDLYETFLDSKFDNRNFRKKLLADPMIKDLNELETNVSHRPAKLFSIK